MTIDPHANHCNAQARLADINHCHALQLDYQLTNYFNEPIAATDLNFWELISALPILTALVTGKVQEFW